jgi:RNA polymerase sigma-70 factor (sigma-E family)
VVTAAEEVGRVSGEWEAEFGEYVAARAGGLVRFAYLLCDDWHRAEDTVQRALTRLYLVWRRLDHTDAIDAYVRTIVVRVLADEGRLARYRRERLSVRMPEPAPIADQSGRTDERMAILAALRRVPPRQRAALVLRYWEDLSVEQAADVLDCSPGTVKSQTSRGLETLRRLLGEQYPVLSGRPDHD